MNLGPSRRPTGVWRRRCGSASGSSGVRAESVARAARRAALMLVNHRTARYRAAGLLPADFPGCAHGLGPQARTAGQAGR